uniref:Flagellar basal body rod modification protein n=1 Tax=Heterorhabditis bacteriophora TaxID=37862 RepID=A0A1I7WMX6_HETBA
MSLPVISNPGQTLDVPMDTEAMLVRTGSGIYLRLANGVILDAKNTIFSTYALPMPMNSGHFSQFRPTSQFNGPNDVIELD